MKTTKITPKVADQLISAGQPVTLHNPRYNETWTATVISCDGPQRRYLKTEDGGVFDRSELFLVK